MRYFTSAVLAISVIALAGCSFASSSSSGSSLPSGGTQPAAATHGLVAWTAINSAGWLNAGARDGGPNPPPTAQRGGNYASEFRSDIGVYGYSPKPNKHNTGPVCTPPGTRYNVNGIASDQKGNLIVPGSSKPGGRNTTGWNISVYQGNPQNLICGPLLGAIPDTTGQPVDAAAFNAATGSIAVSEINFTTKLGDVVVCTVASLSCGAPITSSAITGYGAGVAMDAAGDCWLATSKKVSNGIPVGFRLIYWAGCTGDGVVATGTRQSSYGGLFIDNAGNLGAFDAFNSKLHVYNGCNPACYEVSGSPFVLQGESFYGNLNGSGGKLAVGDVSNGSVDVYNYSLPNVTLRYSFDAGIRRGRLVESGIFSPTNQRLR